MAQKFLTEITLQALNNATTDTDQFLVSDSGTIKFRTGSQMLSDIVGYTPANDANVVHKTGNESIAGIKTFTQGNTTFSNATGSTLAFTTGATTTAEIIINTTFTQFTTFGSFGYLFNGYSGGGISNLLTLDQSGNGIFSANVRATSFTDKDNTAYYLNPAAFSNLYDITANTFVKSGGTSAQYLMADGSVSTGPSLTGYVPTSRTLTINGVTYDLSANRSWTVSVTETDTLATVVDRGNTTNGGRPISMDTSGGGISIKGSGGGWATGYYFTGTAGTYRGGFGALGGNDTLSYYWIGPAYNAYYAYVDVDQLYHTSSVRAPIFYDSNNTAYFLDIATQSEINKVYYNSNMVSRNFGIGQVGVYNASRYQAVFSMGEAYVLPADGTSPSNLYGMAWSHPNAGGVASNLNTHGLLVMENGTFLAAVSGSIRSRDDMRAPIFYDSNNTGYYVDPSATSNLLGLTVVNTITGNISGTAGSLLSYQSNWASTPTPTNVVGLLGWKNYGNGHVIFDASASTTPSGTACNNTNAQISWSSTYPTLMGWNGVNTYGVRVDSARVADSAGSAAWSTITGKPSNIFYYQGFTLDANTMDSNSSGFTYAVNAPFVGPIARFATNGNYDLWINSPYNGGGYGFAFRTRDGDAGTLNPWRYPAIYGVNVNGGGDLYATTYYDQNDTAYYVNPNGTSNINGLLVGGLNVIKTWQTIAGNIDNDYGEGFVTFDPVPTGTPPLASPNIRTVNIGNNFSRRTQLAFDYASDLAYFRRRSDTGWQTWREFIHSGNIGSQSVLYAATAGSAVETDTLQTVTGRGNTTSNGLIATASEGREVSTYLPSSYGLNDLVSGHNYKWYSDTWRLGATRSGAQPAADFVIQFNGSNRINLSTSGNLTASADMRAPVFYDSNDTTYYLDPNNTTKSLNVAGKLTVNVGSSSGTPVFEATGTYGTMSINTYYGVLHTSGDFYIGNPASTGNNLSGNYAYFSIFYDRNNSAYYLDPASGSNLNTGNLAGRWKYSNYLVSNNSGGLMGDYNISGTAAKCIWTIGESWPLGNMYGLAYEYDGTYAHSLSLKANGTTYARLAFGGEGAYFTGGVTSGTAMSSPVYYDSANSAYYFDGSDTGDSIRVAGDIVAYYSDERLKDRKGNIENALDKVLSLNGFYYEPNETAQALGYKKKLEVGVSAQEVQAILPEIIKDAPIGGDYKTLDYGRLTPLLIEAIKEQQTQIDELKELVNKLINK